MKHLHYALLPIVALAFASCSEDLDEFESPKAELEGKFYKQYEITADCSFNDPETRAVLENDAKVNWEDIDKLIIWTGEARDGGNYTVSKANMGEFTRTTKNGVNTFYGYLRDTEAESEPAGDTPLYAYVASEYIEPVYVTSNSQDKWNSETESYEYETTSFLCVDLSEQKGTMEDAMKHDLLWATLPYSDFKNNKIPNVQFEHEMGILKYTLTLEGAGTTTANIRLSGFGMAKKVNFRINTGKGHSIRILQRNYDILQGDIMLKNIEVINDVATIYVALYPSWYAEMQAFVTLADGRRATASVGGNFDDYPIEYTLEAGKIYTASASVTPVEVTAKVGDYYNSDGTYSATPQSNSIGIVFSTETSARDFADGYVNGYVMALQDAANGEGMSWDTKCKSRSYIFGRGNAAICRRGNCWYYERDGRLETNMILKYRAEDHGNQGCEAAYAASTYQPTEGYVKPMGASDWYLPSLAQWYEIIKGLAGFKDGERDEAMVWKDYLPYNLARDAQDLDVCLTWNWGSCNWQKENEVIEWEQTFCYKFKTNMNNRLERAAQAGAIVNTFNINYTINEPNTGSAHQKLDFWTTGEWGDETARMVGIDGGLGGSDYYNGWIGIGWNTDKRYGFPCKVRPVLAF